MSKIEGSSINFSSCQKTSTCTLTSPYKTPAKKVHANFILYGTVLYSTIS